MKILVVQPHYDDAVWSIAEHMLTWISQGHDVAIVTVFGWSGAEKENRLACEHNEAMSLMRLYHWALDYKDDAHPDADDHRPSPRALYEALRGEVERENPDVVVAPIGIHHPDHIAVARAAVPIEEVGAVPVWWYQELPYYVLYPEASVDVGHQHLEEDLPPMRLQGHDDHFAFKKTLCRTYRSQWAPHLERTVFAPERLWEPA